MVSQTSQPTPTIVFANFGLKSWAPRLPKVDFFIDCRGVPDSGGQAPSGTGDDPKFQAYVAGQVDLSAYLYLVEAAVAMMPIRRRKNGQEPWTHPVLIATCCAFGIHRSRAMKHLLGRAYQEAHPEHQVVIDGVLRPV